MKYGRLLNALNSFCETTTAFSKACSLGEPEDAELDQVRPLLSSMKEILSHGKWQQAAFKDQNGDDLMALIRTDPQSFLDTCPTFADVQSKLVNLLNTISARSTLIVALAQQHPKQVKLALNIIPKEHRYRLLTQNAESHQTPLAILAENDSELTDLIAALETLTPQERRNAQNLRFVSKSSLIKIAVDKFLPNSWHSDVFYNNFTYLLQCCQLAQARRILTEEQPDDKPILSMIATHLRGVPLLWHTLKGLSQSERYLALLEITHKESPFVNNLSISKPHTLLVLKMICQTLSAQQLSNYCNCLATRTGNRIFADFMRFYGRLCVTYTATQYLFGRSSICSHDKSMINYLNYGDRTVAMVMNVIKNAGNDLQSDEEKARFRSVLDLYPTEDLSQITAKW